MVRKVMEFYNKENILRQLPYKNLNRIVKDHHRNYRQVPVCVMEVTLKKPPETFQNENPYVKISRQTFENLLPKYVTLPRYARRLQCCCTYHTNMDYIWKAINNLFLKNGKSIPYPNNDALISSVLCDSNSLRYIILVCPTCKSFPNIATLDNPSLKCSKSCLREDENCSKHTILVHQFDRAECMDKGKEKKLMLLDKMIKLIDLVTLFKTM